MPHEPTLIRIEPIDTVTLVQTAEMTLAEARQVVIDSDDMYAIVGDELRALMASIKHLDERRKAITRPMDEAKLQVMEMFREPIALRERARDIMKSAMASYQTKKEEQARQLRLEAERYQREQQERAEQAAREAARQASEAAVAAAAATTEAARDEARARAAELMAESEAHEAVAAAPVVAYLPAASAPKAVGISSRDLLRGEVTDRQALIRYLADHPEYSELIEIRQGKLDRLIAVQGAAFAMPGVRVVRERKIAARTA